MYSINICHLYPELLNIYGDRGNVIALKKRCEWRGIQANVTCLNVGDGFEAEKYDIVFIGGGQDFEMETLRRDLLEDKAGEIKSYIESGKVLLAICGGYQLLGHYYQLPDGKKLQYLGAVDFATVAGKKRLIGNLTFECEFLKTENEDGRLVGFENHNGQTFLGSGVKPMGKVAAGFGNNGQDGTEGAVYKNTYCSYSHGSLLPKNPAFTDYLLKTALRQKYDGFEFPCELNDEFEMLAHKACLMKK